jgi:pectate lyase
MNEKKGNAISRNLKKMLALILMLTLTLGGFHIFPTQAASSNIVHNFTNNGFSSNFFSISGNLSKIKGSVFYNGLTLTQCLKIESVTKVSFTTTETDLLTLVFNKSNSSDIKIDGIKHTFLDGIITKELKPGIHTITKASTANLYYMSLSRSGQTSPTNPPTVPTTPTLSGDCVGYGEKTTGGAGGKEVTVSNASDFAKYTTASSPYIIKIKGTIKLSDTQKVGSNKTVIGVGCDATFTGAGLQIKKASNVIIKNLTINHNDTSVSDNDAIRIEASNNVWVDHCTLDSKFKVSKENSSHKDHTDGACDIKNGSYGVTVSNCLFQNNWKNMLISHSDSATADTAITVTVHHSIFKDCSSRMPSIRFGRAHIYNNYFINALSSTINSRMGAKTYIENNYFKNCNKTIVSQDSDKTGFWNLSNNKFEGCSNVPTNSTCSFKPSYMYSLDKVENIPSILLKTAGAGQ